MKTKQTFCGLLIAGVLLAGVSGCSKKDKDKKESEVEKPTIRNLVVGKDNSKTVHVGGDLFVEADIIAPGKISLVKKNIGPLAGTSVHNISTTLKGDDLEDKTGAHLKWQTRMDDPGKYQLAITVEAKKGEWGRVISEFTVLP